MGIPDGPSECSYLLRKSLISMSATSLKYKLCYLFFHHKDTEWRTCLNYMYVYSICRNILDPTCPAFTSHFFVIFIPGIIDFYDSMYIIDNLIQ